MNKVAKSKYGNIVAMTGASSGIGKAVARLLADEGFKVYALSRSECQDYDCEGGGYVRHFRADITKTDDIQAAVDKIISEAGDISVAINCAGFGIAGPIEFTDVNKAMAQFETNVFANFEFIRLVLPHMRRQGKGLIINTGSIAGTVSLPYQGYYSATKAAILSLTEALDAEVRPFGIRAVVISPGDTKTSFHRARIRTGGSDVYKNYRNAIAGAVKDERRGDSPEYIAKVYLKAIIGGYPPPNIIAARKFYYKLATPAKRILPNRLFRFVINKIYG